MYTPHDNTRADRQSGRAAKKTPSETVGAVDHCLCGVACFLVSVAIVAVLYPVLVPVIRPFHVLSSTALVLTLVILWLVVWLGLEAVREWQAIRQTTDT